jgi:spermidine synthase
LALRIGLPFLLLAAGSPLIQNWFSRSINAKERDPYTLYVASNLGSFTALLAYPFAVEPWMTLSAQSRRWSVGYLLLIGLTLMCGLLASRGASRATAPSVVRERVSWTDRAWWIALAAVPSSLLLGVTTHITTDLAPVPLLWIVPLALYLLTFVIAFGTARPWVTRLVHTLIPYLVITIAVLLFFRGEIPGPTGYAVHAVTFFVCALACHLRLAAARPTPSRLTEFYVWLSVGGALGGLFNVVVAPNAFRSVVEYPLALIATAALSRDATPRWRWADVFMPLLLAIALVATVTIVLKVESTPSRATLGLVLGGGGIAAFAVRARPLRFALCIGAILVAGAQLAAADGVTRFADRSFYGVYRVVDDSASGTRQFYSGTTIHGSERLTDAGHEPLTYYHRDGPLGALFSARSWRTTPWRVGVIGLGTGATASYARPGETWTFYEIDPLVARVAADTTLFRFLSAAQSRPRIVLGDARLSIERDSGARFDVLTIDAFSSDAIPVHLLTREALALYRAHLASDGIIAWHISNKYLDLRPVLEALAADAGLVAIICDDVNIPSPSRGRFPSTWVAMTSASSTLAAVERDVRWVRLKSGRRPQLWTDDFSNVLTVVR